MYFQAVGCRLVKHIGPLSENDSRIGELEKWRSYVLLEVVEVMESSGFIHTLIFC